jgi:hypothetical protein
VCFLPQLQENSFKSGEKSIAMSSFQISLILPDSTSSC